jgi:hypothetical protein
LQKDGEVLRLMPRWSVEREEVICSVLKSGNTRSGAESGGWLPRMLFDTRWSLRAFLKRACCANAIRMHTHIQIHTHTHAQTYFKVRTSTNIHAYYTRLRAYATHNNRVDVVYNDMYARTRDRSKKHQKLHLTSVYTNIIYLEICYLFRYCSCIFTYTLCRRSCWHSYNRSWCRG